MGKPTSLDLGKLKAHTSILHIPTAGGLLLRFLIQRNIVFMLTTLMHQLDSLKRELDHCSLSSLSLPFSFLHLMKRKEESMAARQGKKKLRFWRRQRRWFSPTGLSIYRWTRRYTTYNSNYQSLKSCPASRDFRSTEKTEDQLSPNHKTLQSQS